MTKPALVIMMMSGPDDGRKIYLDQHHGDGTLDEAGAWSLVLGRREECDMSIPFDTQVSRQHAILRLTADGELWLVDMSSRNGTFLEKTRVGKPVLLKRGQLFRLGRTWLRIQPETDEG